MNGLFQQCILSIGRAVVPFSFLFIFISPGGVNTPLPTPTPSPTPTMTNTPIQTVTSTLTPTNSHTPTPSPKPTKKPTPTFSPTPTTSQTPTNSPTPTQTPTPTQAPATSGQLDEWFTKYSKEFSIDRQKLWNIAVCESNLNPNAVNGPYGGMFQFASSSWISTRIAMNMDSNPDLRFHAEEAIKTAAFKISTSGLSAWPSCGK
jgi:hypothetical protein